MDSFFRHLDAKLEKERKNWKKDTVIIMDNAPYHTSGEMFATLQSLNLPILFLGPHSYDAAVCELFFSEFKSVDINPARLPLGKK